MAHYIAELIHDAQTAGPDDRDVSRARCSEAILALWKHRHEFPDGKEPLRDFEPILRTLEALDPSESRPYYARRMRQDAEQADLDSETKTWLEMAEGLDYTARVLISECLAQAGKKAGEKPRDWVELAESAGVGIDVDFAIYDLLNKETYLLVSTEPDDGTQKLLEDRLKRLEAFREAAATLESDLRRRLKSGATQTDQTER
jgi:hypothetical protein